MGAVAMKELHKHLRVFSLRPTATFQEVKAVYRRMVKEWHPDQYGNDPGMHCIAEERIKEINIAYDFLARHFSQRRHSLRDAEGRSDNTEAVVWQPLDRDQFWTNLQPDFLLPVLHEAFRLFGVKNLVWSTYRRLLRGIWEGYVGRLYHSLEVEAEITVKGDRTLVRFTFRYTHESDNTRLGLEEGPDLTGAVGRLIASPRFAVEIRPNLARVYFQDFQLHEVTASEVRSRKVTAEVRADRLDIGGATINQVMGLLYKALTDAGVDRILWDTAGKVMYGTTGWSIRSAGQMVRAVIEGADRQFGIRIQSRPLSYGRIKESPLSDLGRGREDEKRIRQSILARLRGER